MVIRVSYRLPRDGATVVNCVEMSESEWEALREQRDALMSRRDSWAYQRLHDLRVETEAKYPGVPRSRWKNCADEL